MYINPITAIDFYKTDHRRQYPEGTSYIYSNFTPRSSKHAPIIQDDYDNKIVFFGLQYFIKDFLIENWNNNFFNSDKAKVISYYKRRMDNALGKDAIDMKHIEALHDLGYLPIKIKALPEGTTSPIGVPVLTITNTHPDFFWLTNYIETAISCYLWKPITNASIAFEYKKLLTNYAIKTGTSLDFVQYQAHDFSFRGMSSLTDAMISGAAHLTSFIGTDSVSAIDLVEEYYGANVEEELIGCSVPATEHSVMCMNGEENELETIRNLINITYPKGIVSIVADSWDFWKVVTEYMIILKEDVLSRDGKLVLRPDSGDPIKILAGDVNAPKNSPEYKGAVECLWEIFGGIITPTGHKLLNSHIGIIYGDSITLPIAADILKALEHKKFASGNIVLGVGSHTYQYVTRDSFGFAMKATSGVVNNIRREIFKNPKTDSGTKRSAKGLLRVEFENDQFILHDMQTEEQENSGMLEIVFNNGKLIRNQSFKEIRAKINDF